MRMIGEKDSSLRPGCDPRAHLRQHRHLAGDGGQLKGYRIVCVMPENTSEGGASCCACGGAEIVSRPPPAVQRTVRVAKQVAAEHPDWVMLYQYGNALNALAHEEGTGPELLRPALHHPLRRAWAPPGRSWVSAGSSAPQARHRPDRRRRAAVRRGWSGPANLDEGFVPELYDATLIDSRFSVGPRECRAPGTRELLDGEASSPASRPAAILPRGARPGRRPSRPEVSADIALVVCDGGWKYLPLPRAPTRAPSTRPRTASRASSGPSGHHRLGCLRTSSTRLNGVSAAVRKRVKPASVTTSRMRAGPAWVLRRETDLLGERRRGAQQRGTRSTRPPPG